MSRGILWIVPAVALLLCGCDESSNAERTSIQSASNHIAPAHELEIESIVPLTPNRPTHLAIHSNGSLLWVQETVEGQDVTFVMGSQGVPMATPLTSQNILKGLGASKASGNIQSLASGRNELIYVYFSGHVGERAVCCFGQYSLTASRFIVLAETEELLRLSGMGNSLEKSRGRVIVGRKGASLWLTNEETTVGIRIAFADASAGGKLAFNRAFSSIDSKQGSISLTRGGLDVWGGPDESLYVIDHDSGLLHRIQSEGKEVEVHPLESVSSSQPIFDAHLGTLSVLHAESETSNIQPAAFPSMVTWGDGGSRKISFEHALNTWGLDLAAMQLKELVSERSGHFIGFDDASGHIVRIKVKQ